MKIDQTRIAAVEAWFRVDFPDHEVESGEIFDRRVVLFRAEPLELHAPRYELEISYEAFQDHDAHTIVSDLNIQKVSERLRDEPTVRLMYNRFRQLVQTDRHSLRDRDGTT